MRTVVITGGSRGIGAAAVREFSARGDQVFFLYEKNHEAAKAVAVENGAEAICCDVADGEAVKAAFARIPDVDVLICNAGVMHFGLMSMMEESAWDRLFAVNVKGIYHCVNPHPLLPRPPRLRLPQLLPRHLLPRLPLRRLPCVCMVPLTSSTSAPTA